MFYYRPNKYIIGIKDAGAAWIICFAVAFTCYAILTAASIRDDIAAAIARHAQL